MPLKVSTLLQIRHQEIANALQVGVFPTHRQVSMCNVFFRSLIAVL